MIEGFANKRKELYKKEAFYRILNYELVPKDIKILNELRPDVVILDEAQRIKNWKTKTAINVKQLRSPLAMVLTGTPIENKIEELHSIMEFVDKRKLGPLYKFLYDHRVTDEGGKVIGYKSLQTVKESLQNVMIRRRKGEVLTQLPKRIDQTLFVKMTKEQNVIHDENMDIVVRLVSKWRRYGFLTDAEQKRMQIALNFMRMVSDNTYLVDKKTDFGPKTGEVEKILRDIVLEKIHGGDAVVDLVSAVVDGVIIRASVAGAAPVVDGQPGIPLVKKVLGDAVPLIAVV